MKTDENMVFCSKCEYFYSRRVAECKHPDNLKRQTNWRNEYTTSIKHPRAINRNNNCKWFV